MTDKDDPTPFDLRALQARVLEWHEEHFPGCPPGPILDKAEDELLELRAAIGPTEPPYLDWQREIIADELADVQLTLLALSARCEVDPVAALERKFAINKARPAERVRR